MKKSLYIFTVFLLFSYILEANTIELKEDTKYINLLSSSKIYIDKTKKLDINTIQSKEFTDNKENLLGFGYAPKLDVWIKFTLKNSSKKQIQKIIEYDNPLTTNVDFFEQKEEGFSRKKDGIFQIDPTRSTRNPIFTIDLKAGESKTYYIKATSYVTTLIVKLNLWDIKEFYDKEIQDQFVLALFFGAMAILGLYNLFIYFITRDISYLFYVMYIFGITFHHLLYVGIAQIYIFSPTQAIDSTKAAAIFVTIPIYSLALFTKTFLNTKQYKVWNTLLNIFLVVLPIFILIVITTDFFDKYRTLVVLLLFLYLVILTIYATFKKNKQAYYILFGWSVILVGATLMYLSSSGVFNIHQYFSYVVELAIVSEALIFSIALAAKIKTLEEEKVLAHEKLFKQQKNEQVHLRQKVAEKTKELQNLNKDLERRVKEEVSRTKRIERKFMETEKMAAMGEMMGNIAHQWRQPLSVISTESSGLIVRKEYGSLDDETFNRSLNRVIDMTRHLSQTIDDFRDYIKGESEKIDFTIDDCIHKVLSITHPSLKSNYIQEVLDIDESIRLDTYENVLIQSLVNIINNAKDALKDIEPAEDRYLFITIYKKDTKVYIKIKDSAGGIPDGIIHKIFDAYFTTKGEKEGTGLGLHMTSNMITNSLEGTIKVKNSHFEYNEKSFKGAEFTITI